MITIFLGRCDRKQLLTQDEHLESCYRLAAWFGFNDRHNRNPDLADAKMLCDGRDLAKLHGLDMSDVLQLLTVRDGTYSGPARQGGVQPITRPDSGWATAPAGFVVWPEDWSLRVEIKIAIGAAILFVAVLLIGAIRRKPVARRAPPAYTGPSSVYFHCASCGNQFEHTRRTINAWKKGYRRIACNSCHKTWRDSQPPPSVTSPVSSARPGPRGAEPQQGHELSEPLGRSEFKSKSGCLGAVALVTISPLILFLW